MTSARLARMATLGLAVGALLPASAAAAAPPQVFTAVGPAQVSAAQSAFETAIGGSDNGSTDAAMSGGYRVVDMSKAWVGSWSTQSTTSPDGWVDPAPVGFLNLLSFYASGVELGTPGTAITVTDDGFKAIDPAYPALFATTDGTHPLAPQGSTETDVTFLEPTAASATPSPSGSPGPTVPSLPATVAGFGATFLNAEVPNGSSIEYLDAQGQSLGTYPVPTGAPGQPEFLGVLFPSSDVSRATLITGTAPLASGTEDSAAGAGPTNLVALDGLIASEPVAHADGPAPTVTVTGSGAGTSNASAPPVCILRAVRTAVTARGASGRLTRRPALSVRTACTSAARVTARAVVTAWFRSGRRTITRTFHATAASTRVAPGHVTTLTLALPSRLVTLLRAGHRATARVSLSVARTRGSPEVTTVRL